MTNAKRKLILDCDPGTDDSVCIMMALTHPDLELVGITTESGNLTCDITSKNALRILEYLERTEIPVAKGMMHPLIHTHPSDPYSHGEDGLGNHFFPEPATPIADQQAALFIIDQIEKCPGEISIVCTAPLTNLALAIMLKPEIVPLIKEVYHIGGSYGFSEVAFTHATGDTPLSEWNVFVDPEAAKLVYSAGLKLTTIGLDVAYSHESYISDKTLEALRQIGNKQADYAVEILSYIEQANTGTIGKVPVRATIDTVAMCAFICPEILTTQSIRVAVDTREGMTRGMTLWDRRIWSKRKLSEWGEFSTIVSASKMKGELYQSTYVKALGGR